MQLVLSNNRVIAHGENFLSMGGTVINTVTGAKYENATVAECEGCPSDIDSVGYEYHAGQFIPCAPYGKGYGNIAVLCDRYCKAIKDSGISLQDLFLMLAPFELLWENASPTSNFAAQTITLASGDWAFLVIETTHGTEIISGINTSRSVNFPVVDSNGVSNSMRTITVGSDNTKVSFSATTDNSWTYHNESVGTYRTGSYNTQIKPLKIYGVKLGVRI